MSMMRSLMASGRPVPPAPELAQPSAYVWYGCDLRTGTIVEELPFVPGGALSSIIGAYTSLDGQVILPDAPPGWLRATDPGRTMLVCVRAADNVPVWGGLVIKRAGGLAPTGALSLVTLEGYLDRRYVTDLTITDQAVSIAKQLAMMAETEGIGLTYDTFQLGDPPVAPVTHTRTYTSDSDQTIYSQLSELMAVEGGAEWTIQLLWRPDGRGFEKRFRTRRTLGTDQEHPSAVFDSPGSLLDYDYSEDYTSGRGANHVESFGEGEGTGRPKGTPARDTTLLAAGWPRFEFRQTVSGVILPATLNAHNWEALRAKATGAKVFTVVANTTWGPALGVDWTLGDTVAVSVESSWRHPDGLEVRARALGWELDVAANTVTPLLQEDAPSYNAA